MYGWDILVLADMVFDVIFFYGLLKHQHLAWVTLTIYHILSPFLICYVPLINYLKEMHGDGKSQWYQLILFFVISPFIILYLMALDFSYTMIQLVIKPLLLIISCGEYRPNDP